MERWALGPGVTEEEEEERNRECAENPKNGIPRQPQLDESPQGPVGPLGPIWAGWAPRINRTLRRRKLQFRRVSQTGLCAGCFNTIGLMCFPCKDTLGNDANVIETRLGPVLANSNISERLIECIAPIPSPSLLDLKRPVGGLLSNCLEFPWACWGGCPNRRPFRQV